MGPFISVSKDALGRHGIERRQRGRPAFGRMAARAFALKQRLSGRLGLSQKQAAKETECDRKADLSHNVVLGV